MGKFFKLLTDAFTKRVETNDNDPKLQKIGGFLLFAAVLFFVRGVSGVATFFNFSGWISSGDASAIVSNLISFLAAISGILTAYFIYRRYRLGVTLGQITVGLQVLSGIFLLFVSDSYKFDFLKRIFQTSDTAQVKITTISDAVPIYSLYSVPGLIFSLILAVVVVIYFRKSRRVANTLVL
ncbi:MAG: hypothetical protein LBB07_00545 [Bifidobacteriaceae bacterium]|jgi:uncharacterized membrane protein|nr:hypothetical protein [Bifidobacteriaceae bacterium]